MGGGVTPQACLYAHIVCACHTHDTGICVYTGLYIFICSYYQVLWKMG